MIEAHQSCVSIWLVQRLQKTQEEIVKVPMMKEPLEAQMRLCADFRGFVGESAFYSGPTVSSDINEAK